MDQWLGSLYSTLNKQASKLTFVSYIRLRSPFTAYLILLIRVHVRGANVTHNKVRPETLPLYYSAHLNINKTNANRLSPCNSAIVRCFAMCWLQASSYRT